MYSVEAFGQDLVAQDRVIQIPSITQQKGFQMRKLMSDTLDIEVRNYDNYFTVNNLASLFNRASWLYDPVVVKNNYSEIVWDGLLIGIDRNHSNKTALLRTKSKTYQFRNQVIEYESEDWETLADAFKNLCDSVGFTQYNNQSVQTSINVLEDASCKVKININISDNVSFQNAVEKFAEYCNADIFMKNNEIYFIVWRELTGGVSISLTDDELFDAPNVSEDEASIINDYSIGYWNDNDVPATDSANNNLGSLSRTKYGTKTLSGFDSANSGQIIFKDNVSAVWVGESYIKRTNKNYLTDPQPLTKIDSFSFSDELTQYIDLTTRFKMTFSDEVWTNKVFDIYSYTVNESQNKITCSAYEVIV